MTHCAIYMMGFATDRTDKFETVFTVNYRGKAFFINACYLRVKEIVINITFLQKRKKMCKIFMLS